MTEELCFSRDTKKLLYCFCHEAIAMCCDNSSKYRSQQYDDTVQALLTFRKAGVRQQARA